MKSLRRSAPALVATLVSIAHGLASACEDLSTNVQASLRRNTFQVVPINLYAAERTVEEARERYRERCLVPSDENQLIHGRLNCERLRTCDGTPESPCRTEFKPHGTVFLKQGGRNLYGAGHVFFNTHAAGLIWLHQAIESRGPERLSRLHRTLQPDFLLFDHEENLVFDTRAEQGSRYLEWPDPIFQVFRNSGRRNGMVYGFFEGIENDWVRVELPRSLGTGLRTGSAEAADCLYSVGFASGSEPSFQILKGRRVERLQELHESLDGFVRRFLTPLRRPATEILAMDIREALRIYGFSSATINRELRQRPAQVRESLEQLVKVHQRYSRDWSLNDQGKVFSTAPAIPGQSGGPLVNRRGEVVGILSAGVRDRNGVSSGSVSTASFLSRQPSE